MENTNQAEIKNKVKHFMSVLGTGGYSNANYSLCDDDNRSVKDFHNSRFIQASLFKLRCSDFSDGDRISIFITDESEKKHGEDLRTELKDLIGEKKIALDFVKIKNGMTASEQWENFNIMYDAIGDCEEITADLTHGFRTLPIQLYTILGYAETLKKITIKGIYYGAFEHTFGYKGEEYVEPAEVSYLKDKRNLTDEEIKEKNRKLGEITQYTPIIDYNEYLKILSLSRAAFVFEETGYADSLVEEANKSFYDHKQEKEYQELRKHYVNIQALSEDIRFVRGNSNVRDREKSTYDALKKWETRKGLFKETGNSKKEFKAVSNITEYMDSIIEKSFGDLIGDNDESGIYRNVKTGLDIVEWCCRYDLIQAGYTALEETTKTWLESIADDDFIDELKRIYLEKHGEKDKISDHYFREELGNMANDYREYKKGFKELNETTQTFIDSHPEYDMAEIFMLIDKIKLTRNDLNHFGFSNDADSTKNIKRKLSEDFASFKRLIVPKQQEQ